MDTSTTNQKKSEIQQTQVIPASFLMTVTDESPFDAADNGEWSDNDFPNEIGSIRMSKCADIISEAIPGRQSNLRQIPSNLVHWFNFSWVELGVWEKERHFY